MSDGNPFNADIANVPASVSEVQNTDPAPLRQSNLWDSTQPTPETQQRTTTNQSMSSPAGASNHPLDFDVETDRIKLSLSDATDLLTGVATVVALLN